MKKTLIWVFALVATIADGVGAGAVIRSGDQPEPSSRVLQELPQAATAEARGVSLQAIGAAFSGTETIIRLKVTVTDRSQVSGAAGGQEVGDIQPDRDGFDPAGWAGYTLQAETTRAGELLVKLPAMVPDAKYNGAVTVRFVALTLHLARGDVRLPGSWNLVLDGPAPADLAATVRIEKLQSASLGVGSQAIAVTGLRSTSETTLTVALPKTLLVVGQPVLKADSGPVAALSVAKDGDLVELTFPPTPFGKSVTLDLGPVAVPDRAGAERFTVAMSAALARAGDVAPDGTFAVAAADVTAGRADHVLAGQKGSYVGRDWVGIRVLGTYHTESGVPTFFDQDGKQLDVAHVQVGYSKDAEGNVLPGVTDIAAFVGDPAKLTSLTMILGARSTVAQGPNKVVLSP